MNERKATGKTTWTISFKKITLITPPLYGKKSLTANKTVASFVKGVEALLPFFYLNSFKNQTLDSIVNIMKNILRTTKYKLQMLNKNDR